MEFDFEQIKKRIKEHRAFPFLVAVVRGILIYAVFATMLAIVLPAFRVAFFKSVQDMIGKSVLQPLLESLLAGFMLNTVILNFSLFYRRDRESFLATESNVTYDRKTERDRLWRSGVLWAEMGTIGLMMLLFGVSIDQNAFASILPQSISKGFAGFLIALLFSGLAILLRHFSALDAREYWLELPQKLMKKTHAISWNKKLISNYSYWRLAAKLFLSAVLYALVASIITFLLMVLLSIVGIVGLLAMVLVLTPSLLAILLLIIAGFYLRAIKARVKFVRNLKKICRDRGYELFDLKRPYRSIFRDNAEYTFGVKTKEKTFYCRLIACINRGNKYTFTDEGKLIRMKAIHMFKGARMSSVGGYVQSTDFGTGDDLELFGFTSEIDYTFEADGGEKILLLNPVPRRVRSLVGKKMAELDNGAKIMEYTVYAGNAFLRYIDRLYEEENDKKARIFRDKR